MNYIDLGKNGERAASEYLQKKGYHILEHNFRNGRAEIDLIAKLEGVLIFVEVKTRKTEFFGFPEEAVNYRKEMNIRKCSSAYMNTINHLGEIRFDIISIIMDEALNVKSIFHIEDAFFPGIK